MKKILSTIITITILVGFCVLSGNTSFASTDNFKNNELGYEKIETSEFYQNITTADLKNGAYLFHNNGKAIKSDYFKEGKSEGNHLVAVTISKDSRANIETAYFINKDSISEETLARMILERELYTVLGTEKPKDDEYDDPVVKRYSWTWYWKDLELAHLTTSINAFKKTGNIIFNDKQNYHWWNIKSASLLNSSYAKDIMNQNTEMDVSKDEQKLVEYEPIYSDEGTITFKLGGIGIFPISISEHPGKLSIKNMSSAYSSYGKWEFYERSSLTNEYKTEPSVQVISKDSNVYLDLSHSTLLNYYDYENYSWNAEDFKTGNIVIKLGKK